MPKHTALQKDFHLTIVIEDKGWRRQRKLLTKLARAADVVLDVMPTQMKPVTQRAQFTLLLTSDKAVKELNRDFRGISKLTNVLSFPHFTRAQLGCMGKGKIKEPVYVGDIAMAYQYTVDEAKKENKILDNHVTHLLIHGLLHLFGYDHLSEAAAARMERLETKLMAELGLQDPYEPVVKKAKTAKRKRA